MGKIYFFVPGGSSDAGGSISDYQQIRTGLISLGDTHFLTDSQLFIAQNWEIVEGVLRSTLPVYAPTLLSDAETLELGEQLRFKDAGATAVYSRKSAPEKIRSLIFSEFNDTGTTIKPRDPQAAARENDFVISDDETSEITANTFEITYTPPVDSYLHAIKLKTGAGFELTDDVTIKIYINSVLDKNLQREFTVPKELFEEDSIIDIKAIDDSTDPATGYFALSAFAKDKDVIIQISAPGGLVLKSDLAEENIWFKADRQVVTLKRLLNVDDSLKEVVLYPQNGLTTKIGRWDVEQMNAAQSCRFSWLAPSRYLEIVSAKIMLIQGASGTVNYEIGVNSGVAGTDNYEANETELLTQSKVCTAGKLELADITAAFAKVEKGHSVTIEYNSASAMTNVHGLLIKFKDAE